MTPSAALPHVLVSSPTPGGQPVSPVIPSPPEHRSPPNEKAPPSSDQHTKDSYPPSVPPTCVSLLHRLLAIDELSWITPHLNWKGLRPVVRASVALWGGFLLLLGTKSEQLLGQTGFLVLIVGTIAPAALPIAAQFEQSSFQVLIVGLVWAWNCLGLFLAHLARTKYRLTLDEFDLISVAPYLNQGLSAAQITSAVTEDIFHGVYLELGSSAVCIVFLALGGGFLLWLRGHMGPGPVLFATIFGIIENIISMTIGCYFPYPYYSIGLLFFLPFICQTAISLIVTLIVFPETLTHQFCDRLVATLQPLENVIEAQSRLLRTNPRDPAWLEFRSIGATLSKAMGALALLGATETNLTRELSWSRLSGPDCLSALRNTRVLVARSTGFVSFYEIVEKHLHRGEEKQGHVDDLIVHIGGSRPPSPGSTRPGSLHHPELDTSSTPSRGSIDHSHLAPTGEPPLKGRSSLDRVADHFELATRLQEHVDDGGEGRKKSRRTHHTSNLLFDVLHPHPDLRPIGVVESQRYMDLEDFLNNPADEAHLSEIVLLLKDASDEILAALQEAVADLIGIAHRLKTSEVTAEYDQHVTHTQKLVSAVARALEDYRAVKRLTVVTPFARLFDPMAPRDVALLAPSHRGLFWAFSYQFSLIGWAEAFLVLFQSVALLEEKRRHRRVRFPEWTKLRFGSSSASGTFDDEAPDSVPGLDVGLVRAPRNPDFLAATKSYQVIGEKMYDSTRWVTSAGVLFGLKASLLLTLVSLPAFFPSSSYFFYTNRGFWVVIMANLTSTQFVGDTTLNYVVRARGTFLGAVAGLLFWSIGAGSGRGNAYGMAAVAVVGFPMLIFFRLYFVPIVSAIVTCVTVSLVIGYSWQNAHDPAPSSIGYGWDVCWRRFLCVLIGVTAAFIWSYLPPRVTRKKTVRSSSARVIEEMGNTLCQIISFSNCKGDKQTPRPPSRIVGNLAALRAKVGKITVAKSSIKYEVSLRGPWPSEQYRTLERLLVDLLDLLSQFLAVTCALDAKWTKLLLHRAQLDNDRFLGELLASLQLISSSLGNGTPLPMLYNPLLERFLRPTEVILAKHGYGYDVSLDSHDGIPQHVNVEMLSSLDYLKFSCGISIAYAIVNRIDRMMLVAKSLCGETFIVYGLDGINRPRVPEGIESHWHEEADSARHSTDNLLRSA